MLLGLPEPAGSEIQEVLDGAAGACGKQVQGRLSEVRDDAFINIFITDVEIGHRSVPFLQTGTSRHKGRPGSTRMSETNQPQFACSQQIVGSAPLSTSRNIENPIKNKRA